MKKALACTVVSLALLLPLGAFADTLDFNLSPPSPGSISYAGGSSPLIGSGIQVDTVTGLNTPLNNNVTLGISGGALDWTTGALTGTTVNSWTFGGGAGTSITLMGAIPAIGINSTTVLLSGTWGTATVLSLGNNFNIAGATFISYINPTLAAWFGSPTGATWDGNFNISFSAVGTPPGAFSSSQVYSGDVTSSVPEPSTLALLGTGLIGIAGLVRRKLRA